MNHYNLKTYTKEQMLSLLADVFGQDEEGNITTGAESCYVLLPNLQKPTGNTLVDEEGNEYPETERLEGYHCNVVSKIKLDFGDAEIKPKNELVGWAK